MKFGLRRVSAIGSGLGRIIENMAALGCKQAERLLWAYLSALGEWGKTYRDFVRAIQTGPTKLITVRMKEMKKGVASIAAARTEFQQHCKEHSCCSPSVISQTPSPQYTRAGPKLRKPPRP